MPAKIKSTPSASFDPQIISTPRIVEKDFTFDTVNNPGDYRDTWRIFRIMAEFVEGYQFLAKFRKEVTVMGSARFPEDNPYYQIARELGAMLGKNGLTTITGGGPGIMEAANRGAMDVGGESVGLNIQLPHEQRVNPYVNKSIGFYYFFTRKVMLTAPANAFVYFPGGFGTMDEFFEVVDLIEINKMARVPIILVGSAYWNPLLDFLKKSSGAIEAIEPKHLDLLHVVDSAEEAFKYIEETKDKEISCDLSPLNFHCEGKVDWKIFRIMAELVEGFDFLTGITHGINVLGSKSVQSGNSYYTAAHELGKRMAKAGFATVTGGGPGFMEAVNKGAFENGGTSVGISMRYGYKDRVNPYVQRSIGFQFPFTRKLILTTPSDAFVFFPGGFGTMHQLFEVLTLIQTRKMKKVPVILYDHAFWEPLHAFIKKTMVHDVETIVDEDDELYEIVDDVGDIMRIIEEARK